MSQETEYEISNSDLYKLVKFNKTCIESLLNEVCKLCEELADLRALVEQASKNPTTEQSEAETPLKIGDTVEIVSYAYAYQTTDKMDADIFKRMGFNDHNVNVCTPALNGRIGNVFAIDVHSKNQEILYGVDIWGMWDQVLITRKGLKLLS